MPSNVSVPISQAQNHRNNTPDYFYEYFATPNESSPSGRQGDDSTRSNRIALGQWSAFPNWFFEWQYNGSNANQLTPGGIYSPSLPESQESMRYGGAVTPETYLRAVRDKAKSKARYVAKFFK